MRFIIDGRLDIRPLASQDIPQEALPYDDTVIRKLSAGIADGAAIDVTITNSDWGAANDYYLKRIVFYFTAGSAGNDAADEGILIYVTEDSVGGIYADIFSDRFVNSSAGFVLRKTIDFAQKNLINQANGVNINILNASGVAITLTDIYFIGTPRTV